MLQRRKLKKSQDMTGWTLFQEEILANLEVLPGSEGAKQMTETSGRICSESYKSSSPLGLLTRILLEDSQWTSTRCYLTWRVLDMKQGHLLFQLVPSMPHIEGIEYSFLPTCRAAMSRLALRKKTTGNFANVFNLEDILHKNGYKLHPNFAEWMMGFPQNWTELD